MYKAILVKLIIYDDYNLWIMVIILFFLILIGCGMYVMDYDECSFVDISLSVENSCGWHWQTGF